MKALAHPTRLFLVDQLSEGERCVCELSEMVDADLSTVSRHLAVLRQAGIIQQEKRGQQVWCSLKVPCILNFFGCVQDVLQANARRARQVLTRR